MKKRCPNCKFYKAPANEEPCRSCEASDWGKEKHTYPGWESAKRKRADMQAEIDTLKERISDLESDGRNIDGSLDEISRLAARLLNAQAIIDEQAAELDELLATCTDLAVAGAASDLFRLYDWGEE